MSRKLVFILLAVIVALGFVVGPQWGRPSNPRVFQTAGILGKEPGAGAPRDAGDERVLSKDPLEEPPVLAAPVVDEILEIRREQGELLKGTLLDQPVEGGEGTAAGREPGGSFQEALQRVAANDARTSGDTGPALHSTIPAGQNTGTEAQLVESLRRTCRLLARRAEVLEDRGDYAAANRLRRLSTRLRRETRLLESP